MFKVSEKGRQRVLRERKKNVHAWVTGTLKGFDTSEADPYYEGYYNPYETEFFIDHCSKDKLDGMYTVYLMDKKIFYEL